MDNKNNQNDNPNKKKNIKSAIILLVVCLGITALFTSVMSRYKNGSQKKISYSKFLTMLDKGEIKKVQVADRKIYIEPKTQQNPLMKTTYYTVSMNDALLVNRLKEAEDQNKISSYEQQDSSGSNAILSVMVSYVLPFVLIYGMMYFVMRGIGKGGGMMGSVGKSNAKVYVEKKTGVTFADVAGQDEAKESLTEMVDFLHNPGKYIEIGARLPKGALLVGPPGTGKTLLAKAVAGEANVPFFSLSGSDFVEMFVGVGASRVRDLFKQAQSMAPCIIFIDEIDAIGKSRDSRYGGGNDEREQTLNALLAEMDGFDSSKGLVILAATNRPEVLDKALLRPGRFDRRVIVERPDLKGRVETLKVHAKNVKMDETVNFDEIALATSGAVHYRPSVKITILNGFQTHKTKLLRHTVLCHHRSCNLCCSFDIIRSSCCNRMEYNFLCCTSSKKCYKFSKHLLFAHKVLFFFRNLHRITKRSHCSWNNRNLLNRFCILLYSDCHRMPHLVVSNDFLFFFAKNTILLFFTCNNYFHSF